jgi:hypothetical protein
VNLIQLTQGRRRNSFKLYNFHTNQWSVRDIVERDAGTIVASGVTWRLGVAVDLMEDSSSPKYMEV